MPKKSLYYAVAAVGLATASGTAWWYQSKPKGPTEITASGAAAKPAATGPQTAASAPRASGVEVAQVEKTRLQDDAQAVGTLRSRQSVMLRPEVAGRISLIGFKDGARVSKGQVLVQLDDSLQKAEMSQAQAQVSIAAANLKRNQELVAQNFVAQRVLDESAANLQVAQAQLALAQARSGRMRITAPFDATAGIRTVNLGDFVKDGADLVNLEDLSSMYVDFRVPERFQTRIKPGQSVELQLDALPGRAFTAKIEAIDPQIDVNGRSVAVRAVVANNNGQSVQLPGARPAASAPASPALAPGIASASAPGKSSAIQTTDARKSGAAPGGAVSGRPSGPPSPPSGPLRPGMFARVTAVFSINDNALVVPEEAIVPQSGRQFVIKVVAPSAVPGTATAALGPEVTTVSLRQEVKLGNRRGGKVEITEGLSEGQTVVVAGQQRLQRDGTAVRVVELGRPVGPTPGASPVSSSGGAVAGAVPAPPPSPSGGGSSITSPSGGGSSAARPTP